MEIRKINTELKYTCDTRGQKHRIECLTSFSKSKIHVLPVRFFCLNTIQTYADFLFQIILFADCSIDVFNKHLAMAFTGLSWLPLSLVTMSQKHSLTKLFYLSP